MDDRGNEARFFGGLALTAALLAALHWFPWFRKLHRLEAYSLGTASIVAGQGVYLGFDARWRKLTAFSIIGGLVVYWAWLYDGIANQHARQLAGRADVHEKS
jgi:hypothetical protein